MSGATYFKKPKIIIEGKKGIRGRLQAAEKEQRREKGNSKLDVSRVRRSFSLLYASSPHRLVLPAY